MAGVDTWCTAHRGRTVRTHTSHTQYHQASHPIHWSHHALQHHSAGVGLGTANGRMYSTRRPSGAPHPAGGFCMAGVRLGALPRGRMYALRRVILSVSLRGRMYALVSLRCPSGVSGVRSVSLVSAALPVAFAWQAWDLVHCKGSDVQLSCR